MIIFRKYSFYIALMGSAVAAVYIWDVMTPRPAPAHFVEPAANPYQHAVAASGIIEAQDRNVSIGAPASGLVENIFFNVSDHVKKGDILFTIDSRDLRASLEVQKANVKVSEATLEKLKDQLQRLESVKDVRAISTDEIKTKQHEVQVAEADYNAAQAHLKEIQILIGRLSVEAPKDGVIIQNNLRVGEYFNANGSVPAMVLGTLDKLQIRADIDEQNASNLIIGAKATAFPHNNTTLAIPLTFSYVEPFVIPKKSLTGASTERVDTRVLQVIYTFERPKNFNVYVGQQVDVFIEAAPENKS